MFLNAVKNSYYLISLIHFQINTIYTLRIAYRTIYIMIEKQKNSKKTAYRFPSSSNSHSATAVTFSKLIDPIG